MTLMTVYSLFLSSLIHFIIHIKQTDMLNVHILFLCLYKIYIHIILKIWISISQYFQNIVSKLKCWYRIITNVCSVVFFIHSGWKSKQTWGYFPSATNKKEEHVDAIFRPCGRKFMCSKCYFLSPGTEK